MLSIAFEQKTCDLYVDNFTLEFKKIKEGHWLHTQEKPGGLSKVVKMYELTGSGYQWDLTETRIPTKGAKEEPNQTFWSWKNVTMHYELPCDFISHGQVGPPRIR